MSNAHAIANTFDAAGLTLAGVFHGCMEDARARQDAVDHDQALRNASATQRAVYAVERQRAALVATQRENAALRDENARLRAELALMRTRALRAEGRVRQVMVEAAEARGRRAA